MKSVNRKKILFLVTQSEMGGAQRYIYEVSKALAERYEILVAAGDPAFAKASAGKGELFQKLKNTRVRPVYLKRMKRTPNPYLAISAIAEIARLLKKERPDVLFLCSTTAGLLGSIAARIYRGRTSPKITGEVRPQKIRVIYRIGGWAFGDPRAGWKNSKTRSFCCCRLTSVTSKARSRSSCSRTSLPSVRTWSSGASSAGNWAKALLLSDRKANHLVGLFLGKECK